MSDKPKMERGGLRPTRGDDVLENNVSSLLETGGEAPRIADAARARIRAHLVDQLGTREAARTRGRVPVFAVLGGLAATAVLALVLLRVFGGGAAPVTAPDGSLADGSTFLTAPGGKVTQLGPRHVRVEGAALLDVAAGQGTFTVETERGRIEVLGTRFLVDGEHDRTTAAVVRGQVKLATDTGDVVLHAGEQGVAEAGRPPVRGPAPRLSHLVSWAQEARRREEHVIEPLHHGTLFARDPGVRSHPPWGEEYPLPIRKLGVDIVVEDQVARIALDQTFHNEQNQALEGVYRFAIPADAALQRLAMYVDGKLEESAVVERMQARRIYEELVYRRVDPALLEWAGTGRLSLRVYPIPALQDKRLVLAYTQSIPKLYDDYTLSVPLPEVDQPVGELVVSMRIKGCARCELSSTSHQIQVAREGDDAIVSYRHSADQLGDSFVVHVRDPQRPTTIATHQDGSDRYMLVRANTALGVDRSAALGRAADLTEAAGPRPYHPRTWVLLDDVSASRSPFELRAQQDLVDAFVRELDEDDRVAVVAFDVEAREKLAATRVRDVDRRALRKALDGEGGVGATDFSVALASATKLLAGTAPEDAMIVYLGDGVITSGPRELDKLRAELTGKAHFVGVGVGDGPDTQTLDALAAATAGYSTTIDLSDDVGWRAFDLVAALHTARVTDVSARLVDAHGQLVPATLYLRSPQLADGEELELVAKLAGSGTPAAVELAGTRDGAAWRQTIALASAAHDGGYLPRLWAQRHIAARLLAKHEAVASVPCVAAKCPTDGELREARDESIRQEVVALGKKYFLLSRHTSLLVLENDEMYAKYGVAKGAGDTWAPYKLPPTIAVAKIANAPTKPADVADDAELVRQPIAAFYDPSAYYWHANAAIDQPLDALQSQLRTGPIGVGSYGTGFGFGKKGGGGGGGMATRAELGLDMTQREPAAAGPAPVQSDSADKEKGDRLQISGGLIAASSSTHEHRAATRRIVTANEVRGFDESGGRFAGDSWGAGEEDLGYLGAASLALARFGYPADPGFDDVTGFVPALVSDASDAWRARFAQLGGDAPHSIDKAAADLLARARRELPAGIYRWGERELAVDAARRIGWRRTTEDGLAETASYDGHVWTRRYAELGLDASRAMADDDIALSLAYLPLWIADAQHYARWFDVTAKGNEVSLAAKVAGASKVQLVLAFDDHARLIQVRDGHGTTLLEITWGTTGPTAAKVGGESIAVGFTPETIGDATAWAHGASQAGVVIELPLRMPAYWQARVERETPGTPSWRDAQRQHLASLAATQARGQLLEVYEELRLRGGVELGDLALASGGLATQPDRTRLAESLAPFASQPLAQYLAASRAFAQSAGPSALAPKSHDGFVGALWQLRWTVAQLQAEHGKGAIDAALAIDARAPRLRVIAAAAVGTRYDIVDGARAWDGITDGPYKNIARVQAAQMLANRGDYNGAAERIARLASEYDLKALPARIEQAQWYFNSARRGPAGWQLVWGTWRDRVLAGDSFAHVMALVPSAAQHPGDLPAVLARAAELAGNDVGRKLAVARFAITYGQRAWGEQLLEPMLKSSPTRELYQEIAQLHVASGKLSDALAELEAAQDAGADEAVDIDVVRGELAQIIAVAHQLAVQSTGAERKRAIGRAMWWASRWRAIDPGNTQIDEALGQLLLAVGDTAGAWRQLSSTIERDPWSGNGYMTVADAFEKQGKVDAALPFWQQAIVIDQTNPTARLRKAQALIALGRSSEGDALLAEISHRKWHDMWSGVVYQAQDLLSRGKAK